jgi:hypothetical protein
MTLQLFFEETDIGETIHPSRYQLFAVNLDLLLNIQLDVESIRHEFFTIEAFQMDEIIHPLQDVISIEPLQDRFESRILTDDLTVSIQSDKIEVLPHDRFFL